MIVQPVEHHRLEDYLARTGAAGLFARHVASARPNSTSLAVVDDGRIRGLVIAGREHGLYEAYSHWLFAKSPDVASMLVSHLDMSGISLSYPIEVGSAVIRALGDARVKHEYDRIYLLPRTSDVSISPRVERLTTAALRRLEIAPMLAGILGPLDDWGEASRLHGIVDRGALVSIAESWVRDGTFAAIQQVVTLDSHRGRGLARDLVAHVSCELLEQQLQPLYVVAESNGPSVRLVERLGFVLHERWGYAESVTSST